jgi:hypothetical protein
VGGIRIQGIENHPKTLNPLSRYVAAGNSRQCEPDQAPNTQDDRHIVEGRTSPVLCRLRFYGYQPLGLHQWYCGLGGNLAVDFVFVVEADFGSVS